MIIFKEIPGYAPYQAGSDGNIYRNGRMLSSRSKKNRYLIVTLSIHGKTYTRHVHRLVCAAFHGTTDLEVRHLDGTRTNNIPENLSWSDKRTNQNDKIKHGTILRGSSAPWSKIDENDVLEIRAAARMGIPQEELAKKFALKQGTISDIIIGRKWKHVPGQLRSYDMRRKFTDDQIREIRSAQNATQEELALKYGVARNSIFQILKRISYTHVI